jgi:hypothetical protein
MNQEGNSSCAQFFYEKVTEEIVVLGKVAHIHDFCRTPR